MIEKIISGGQTGTDRGALDFALEHNIAAGGFCPLGRKAEDGQIPDKYPLEETETDHYEERTVRNVVESDGTLVITAGPPSEGTAFTIEAAYEVNKPFFMLDLARGFGAEEIRQWITHHKIATLNIAGPRESAVPGITDITKEVLGQLFLPQ